jgi:hypothetical protein
MTSRYGRRDGDQVVLRAALALFVLLISAASARAETLRLRYEAAVLNVVVLGEANYEVAATPTRYVVRGGIRTSGLARLFDQTEITATTAGVFAGDQLAWTRYDISHAYAGKFRRIQIARDAAGVRVEAAPRFGDLGQPEATPEQRAGSFDPLSGVFALGRQIANAQACRGSAPVFDGRQHYRLSVSPRGQGAFNGGGYQGPALNCTMRYEPIAGFSADFDRSRLPTADVWFSLPARGSFAAPLRLTIQSPLGAAQLDIRGYERVG